MAVVCGAFGGNRSFSRLAPSFRQKRWWALMTATTRECVACAEELGTHVGFACNSGVCPHLCSLSSVAVDG